MKYRLVLCSDSSDENVPGYVVAITPESLILRDAVSSAIAYAKALATPVCNGNYPVVITFPFQDFKAFDLIDDKRKPEIQKEMDDIFETFDSRGSFVMSDLPEFAKGEYIYKNRKVYLRINLKSENEVITEVIVEESYDVGDGIECDIFMGEVDLGSILTESPTVIESVF